MRHFPLEVEYQDTKEKVIVDSPSQIEAGRTFKVLNKMKVYVVMLCVEYEGCNAPVAICSSRDEAAKVIRKIRHDYENYRIEPGCLQFPKENFLVFHDSVFVIEYEIDKMEEV